MRRVQLALPARWLAAVDGHPGGALPLAQALDLQDVLRALAPLRPVIEETLGAAPWCLAGQCWVRRARPPHSWHQDGALHHDFMAQSQPPAEALLALATCWMALTPCGDDAPGLEWVVPPLDRLLGPPELTDAAVRSRFPAAAFVHPRLAAGEALVFGGGLLHRTHVTPAMTRPRTSIELRFCAPPPPPRLAAERQVAMV